MKSLEALLGLLLVISVHAEAGLISSVHVDSTSALDVSWIWDGALPSADEPALENWNGSISLSINESFAPTDSFIGSFFFIHSFDPQTFYLGPILIPGNNESYGLLLDSSFTIGGVNYQFLFDRAREPTESTIRATASQIPSPGSLYLFVLGFIGLTLHCGGVTRNKAAHTASFAGWTRGQAARLWPRRYVQPR